MSQIFISYSRKDLKIAEKIINVLAQDDLEPWIDWKSIPKGERFEREIQQGIEEAEIFLFLVSPDSSTSEWCNQEIDHAVKNGKRILPLLIRDTDPKITHPEIAKRNWIFCRDDQDDINKAIEETRRTIQTDYEWLKYHTELQVKALKWEQRKDNSRLLRGKELREVEQQLAEVGTQEDPQPTKLQREFILASRINEERQRRQIIFGLSLGIAIMTALAIFAFLQRNEAILQTNAKSTALANEEIAKQTAIAEEKRANEQSEIALSRQLAAQAELLISQNPTLIDRAVLLSIEALNHSSTYEGSEALRHGLALLPKLVLSTKIEASPSYAYEGFSKGITVIVFSPDGKLLAIGTQAGMISVWETTNWTEIMRAEPAEYGGRVRVVRSLMFSPDGRMLISGADSGFAQVWDITTKQELSRFFHDDQVFAVAFNPAGTLVASGGGTEVVLWDPFSGNEVFTFSTGSDYIVFSPDNTRLATASCNEIQVWDLKAGNSLTNKQQWSANPNDLTCITALSFSPDSSKIASADGESGSGGIYPRPKKVGGTILVWDALTGQDISVMRHGDSVQAIAFSENGNRLVSGSYDRTSRVWDTTTGMPIHQFSFGPSVTAVTFGHDADQVIASGSDGSARVWDAITGEEKNRLVTGENATITTLALHPNAPYVVAGNSAGEIWIWQISGEASIEMDLGQYTSISSVSYNKDGSMLVTASYDKTARSWDVLSGDEIARVTHEDRVLLAVFNPDKNQVASGSMDGVVKIWDARTGKEEFVVPKLSMVADIKYSSDGKYLAIAEGFFSRDGLFLFNDLIENKPAIVSIWDTATGREVNVFKHDNWVNSIAFSPDGSLLLTGSTDGTARIWNISTGKEISRVSSANRINLVAYSPNGDLVASVESCFVGMFGNKLCEPQLKVWSPSNGEIIWKKNYPGIWVPGMAFSPDGERFAIANTQSGGNSSVSVLDAQTGNPVSEKIYDANFLLVAFSFNSDGTLIASGGGPIFDTGRLDIWDSETGKDLTRIPYWQPWSVSFSPDDRSIAVGGAQDGVAVAKIVPVNKEDLVAMACERLGRNLTKSEWAEYFRGTKYEEKYNETCGEYLVENEPDGNSNSPMISASGQNIVFVSEATNLVCSDTNNVQDVFLYRLFDQSIELISASEDGLQADNSSSLPEISADGNFVVFASIATNLIPNDDNNFCGSDKQGNCQDIFLYNTVTKSIKAISVNSDGELGNGDSDIPSISGDGRYVVFSSSATNLIANDRNNYCDTNYDGDNKENCMDIFLHDNQTDATYLISANSKGVQANGASESPVISADGRYIVFYSEANNLDMANQSAGWYIHDRETKTTKFLSDTLQQSKVHVSQNAEYLAGIKVFNGNGELGEYDLEEVVVLNSKSGTEQIISVSPNDDLGNHDSESPFLSLDGKYIVFSSEANNLVEKDTNIAFDVFIWDQENNQLQRVSMPTKGTESNGNSRLPSISSNGRYVVYISTASNLVTQDKNKFTDIFIYDTVTGKTTRIEPASSCN